MSRFFTRERFGRPQLLAGFLLLIFLAQCVWLGAHSSHDIDDAFRVAEGLRQWHGMGVAGTPFGWPNADAKPHGNRAFTPDGYDPNHSPGWYLIAAAPILLCPATVDRDSAPYWEWLQRAPFLAFGVLLGASVWYVARRLYGNAGGYIALALYCFSPQIIRCSSLWFEQPETGAAWGTFGAVFTAIAVTHTLYAPREVVLWNWRRILLLGLSLALAVGSQFSLWILVPAALGFMLYLAPERRGAAVAIWTSSCAFALLLLYTAYFFRPWPFWQGIRHASFLDLTWHAYAMPGAYREMARQLSQSGPALVVAVPIALAVYVAWSRSRYFGNTAPLLASIVLLALALGNPHYPGEGFRLIAVPFLFVFVGGICADLIETRQRSVVTACICGLLSANALWNLWELARVGGR